MINLFLRVRPANGHYMPSGTNQYTKFADFQPKKNGICTLVRSRLSPQCFFFNAVNLTDLEFNLFWQHQICKWHKSAILFSAAAKLWFTLTYRYLKIRLPVHDLRLTKVKQPFLQAILDLNLPGSVFHRVTSIWSMDPW